MSFYNKTVFITFSIEGLHHFPSAANLCTQGYLENPHRHLFHFKCWWAVEHDNRDIEFIEKKHEILAFFSNYSKEASGIINFGSTSCEMLATLIIEQFGAVKVEVSEDGENGAVVERIPKYVSHIPL